jgi:hypothetical protein
MKILYRKCIRLLALFLILSFGQKGWTQVNNNGCVVAGFGIDAGLYSGVAEFGAGTPGAGSNDWFQGASGRGVINQSNPSEIQTLLQSQFNPVYQRRTNGGLSSITDVVTVDKKYRILIDAIWARDLFGGTGGIDQSSYTNASKNGEDPAIWAPGPANVLGKNDLIDVAGHMFRDVDVDANKDDLWFVGLINRAEPGGTAYMDFEFYVADVKYNGSSFTSGGPQLGHTAYTFDGAGNITKIGDLILNVSLTNGGATTGVETRIWVSRSDYMNVTPVTFNWGPNFDGAFNGSPYGYASIIPKQPGLICGYVNLEGQRPAAPPWGTKGTKANTFGTSYIDFSVAEMGINLTALGLDHSSLSGADPCFFPLNTFIIKTRASDSFTAQLKDFAGPYAWGQPNVDILYKGDPKLSCANPTVTLDATPNRADSQYQWSTVDGNILSRLDSSSIVVDRPGTYKVMLTLPTDCPIQSDEITVVTDPTKPLFTSATTQSTVSCNGNDGTVKITVKGGTQPYTYSWRKDGVAFPPSTQTITGLSPGRYVATVTDKTGCTIISDTAIVNLRTPVVVNETVTPVTCKGEKNGAISLSVSGKDPFTYLWSNGQTTQSIVNVIAGTYSVTITDADGCKTTLPYTVGQPEAVTASATKTNDTNPVPGIANANGTITLSPSGGTPGYTYSWTGPNSYSSTSQNLSNLEYGDYTVTVTDAKGCTSTTSVFIYEPEICNDDKDNDGDGFINCQDSDCKPEAPGAITQSDPKPCKGETVTYSTAQVGTLTYQWTLPPNASLINGQGTSTITVIWNSSVPGQVCVKAINVGCESSISCITVNPREAPLAPGAITKN